MDDGSIPKKPCISDSILAARALSKAKTSTARAIGSGDDAHHRVGASEATPASRQKLTPSACTLGAHPPGEILHLQRWAHTSRDPPPHSRAVEFVREDLAGFGREGDVRECSLTNSNTAREDHYC